MYIVGIAGGSGSGKTTFAHKVKNQVSSNTTILHMDSYYLPLKNIQKANGKINFDHPGAFDWELLRSHLKDLKDGKLIDVPTYDFKSSERIGSKKLMDESNVILFEGIFSLFDQRIREMMDITCFLHVDSDIRFIRRLHRDVKERGRSLESVIEQYYETVRPMYQKYLEPQRQFANFIVGEETDIAASILAARIKEFGPVTDAISQSQLN